MSATCEIEKYFRVGSIMVQYREIREVIFLNFVTVIKPHMNLCAFLFICSPLVCRNALHKLQVWSMF